MKNKKIVVAVKICQGEINPFDASALEVALRIPDADITVISMAPDSMIPQIESLSRYGVKTLTLSDKLYAGSDTVATSLVLATAIARIDPDYVFCGRQSIDGDTAQVPVMISARLGYGLITGGAYYEDDALRLLDGRKVCVEDKTVITFCKYVAPRFFSIFSKVEKTEIWDNSVLNISEDLCGSKGSPTKVIRTYENMVGRRSCQFVEYDRLDELIRTGLTTKHTDGVTKKINREVYYYGDLKEYADSLFENSVRINGADVNSIVTEIQENKPKVVLFADDGESKELAARVAIALNTGLCADCTSFDVQNGKFVMTRPAMGGNVTADIVCSGEVALATVRTARKDQSEIMFCVGDGCIDKVGQIKALASKYGAEICATRKVVDKGVMPYECQVGLTGKTVSPKVYVCFGVSGAVQHTSAIEKSGIIIAINKDKNERIFDYADYGIIKEI